MRKIRVKDGILEIITERYLTPVQYSAYRQNLKRIWKMVETQPDETTKCYIGTTTAEDASKILTVTFAVKFPSLSENSFVDLNEVEQKLESFTEDVIGTINSWVGDEKTNEEKSLEFTNASLEECREYMQKIAKRIVGMKDTSVLVMIANKTQDGIGCHTFGDMNKGFAIMNLIERNEAE